MIVSNREKIQILNYRRNLHNIFQIYRVFERNEISPVLIKGLAAASYYPKPYQRDFSDVDLAVDPKDFEPAKKIIGDNNLNVDLHRGLRHLDTVDWDDLFDNSLIEKIENVTIRVLRPEDHLRVLCTHWLNDGGEDRTRLWDIYFTLKKNINDFDCGRFLDPVDEKRQKWLLLILAITGEYLGLNLKEIDSLKEHFELSYRTKKQIEKAWKSDVRLISLLMTLKGGNSIFEQMKKRFPPNIFQSIVETDSNLSEDAYYSVRAKGFILRAKKLFEALSENMKSGKN